MDCALRSMGGVMSHKICKHNVRADECSQCFNERQIPVDAYLNAHRQFMSEGWHLRTLGDGGNMSAAEIEEIAGAIMVMAKIWCLSPQEIAENLSRFMTENEFNRVVEAAKGVSNES